MKWKTAISGNKDGEHFIRGHALSTLMQEHTFAEVTFLLLTKRLPTPHEQVLFNMILVACIEHGIESPSDFVPRISISVGNPMNAAMAAGLLAIGDWHGGAAEELAHLIQGNSTPDEIVMTHTTAHKRLPGFGHKVYKNRDPRAVALLHKATELGLATTPIKKLYELERALEIASGKHIPLNIDGALAACMCELGIDWQFGKALFGFARMPGMMAHAHEETTQEKPYRRLDSEDVQYTGPAL